MIQIYSKKVNDLATGPTFPLVTKQWMQQWGDAGQYTGSPAGCILSKVHRLSGWPSTHLGLQDPSSARLCCWVASVLSNSVRPHRQQPTRLPRPWDSPGKNTGVGCHLLLQCMKVKSESEGAQSCPTLSDPMDCSLPGSSTHGIFQARVLEWAAIAFSASKALACTNTTYSLYTQAPH